MNPTNRYVYHQMLHIVIQEHHSDFSVGVLSALDEV